MGEITRHSRAGGNPFRPVILSEAKNLALILSPLKGEGRAVKFETSRFRATGEFLSFAQPTERNQRTGYPTAACFLRLRIKHKRAADGRLRNSRHQRSSSPRRFPSAAQAEGAEKGDKNHATQGS